MLSYKNIVCLLLFLPLAMASAQQTGKIDYREEMREFVISISKYAKTDDPDFIVIPQNGEALITKDGTKQSNIHHQYLNAIDGIGRENLFYGDSTDNVATPYSTTLYSIGLLDIAKANGKEILVTNYAFDTDKMDDALSRSAFKGYISFSAPNRELDIVPEYPPIPHNQNNRDILTLNQADNFLYLINPSRYDTKKRLIEDLSATNYDVLILDLFFHQKPLTSNDVQVLKTKANGGQRLVIAYMSIGEAEDYRNYWQPEWKSGNPAFLRGENPNWEGNYKVAYWDPRWQSVITGNRESYLQKIINAGFDGVYLDLIDAFWFYENQENSGQ